MYVMGVVGTNKKVCVKSYRVLPNRKVYKQGQQNLMSTILFYLLNIFPQKANRTPWKNS